MKKYTALMRILLICFDSDIILYSGLSISKFIRQLLTRIRKHLSDSRGEVSVPKYILEAIIDDFLPDIIEYYESEEGQHNFELWKSERIKNAENEKAAKVTTIKKKSEKT